LLVLSFSENGHTLFLWEVYILIPVTETRQEPRIRARWPVSVITDGGVIQGESRNITGTGVFISCEDKLRKNETCRMVITPPHLQSFEVKGQVMWSNFESMVPKEPLFGTGFSFVKISEDDRRRLNNAVYYHL
jgi:hypothetical protein